MVEDGEGEEGGQRSFMKGVSGAFLTPVLPYQRTRAEEERVPLPYTRNQICHGV